MLTIKPRPIRTSHPGSCSNDRGHFSQHARLATRTLPLVSGNVRVNQYLRSGTLVEQESSVRLRVAALIVRDTYKAVERVDAIRLRADAAVATPDRRPSAERQLRSHLDKHGLEWAFEGSLNP